MRATAMALAILVIIGGGLFAGWTYTQRQYYVGATDEGQVAVFRGIQGQIAGVDLSTVHRTSSTRLDDLTVAAQDTVKVGIRAKSEPDAERQLAELTSDTPTNPNLKPICPPDPTAVGGTPSASPTTALPGTTPEPNGSPSAGAPVTPNGVVSASPTLAATDLTSPSDATPSDSTAPGLDPAGCRSPE